MATLSQLQKLGEGLKRISADISERVLSKSKWSLER